METGKNGVTANTPKNILFGAGTIHKNLAYSTVDSYALTSDETFQSNKTYYIRSGEEGSYVYDATTQSVGANVTANTYYEKTIENGTWNFATSIVGATNGGSKLSIVPELADIPMDGASVAVKGLKVKIGETATMDVNFAELTKDLIKSATLGADGTSVDTTFDLIESKNNIEIGDYIDNIAFVGLTLDNRKIIVVLENALCTSGFEQEGKNKEGAVGAYTFTCHADPTSDEDLDKLPWQIYYPLPRA